MANVYSLVQSASTSFSFNRMMKLSGTPERRRFRAWYSAKATINGSYENTPLYMTAAVDNKPEKIEVEIHIVL